MKVNQKEVFTMAGIAMAAFFVAAAYLATLPGKPRLYSEKYGPALMVATGHGYEAPSRWDEKTTAFLRMEQEHIGFSDVRPEGRRPLCTFEKQERYAQLSLALFWRVFGLDWGVLQAMSALFFALGVVGAYLLARAFLHRPWAILAAVGCMTAPGWLYTAAAFRDVSKFPFVMGLLAIGAIVVRAPQDRWLWAYGGVLGLVGGIGMGFRPEIGLYFWGVMVLAALLNQDTRTRRRVFCTWAVLLYVLVSWPVWVKHHNNGHGIALGFVKGFQDDMGLNWHYGDTYEDAYMYETVDMFCQCTKGEPAPPYWSKEYDRACMGYAWNITKQDPLRMVHRWFRAAWLVAGVSDGRIYETAGPQYPKGAFLERMQRYRAPLELVAWCVPLFCLFLLIVQWRFGLYLSALWLGYGGLSSLQFHTRHLAHLEVLGWIALFGCICIGRGMLQQKEKEETCQT